MPARAKRDFVARKMAVWCLEAADGAALSGARIVGAA